MATDLLLLGAGLMAKPAVQVLDKAGISVTVASRTLASAEQACKGTKLARLACVDVTDAARLDVLVGSVKLVLCLVPYIFNTHIVKSAIRCKTNVVTTSYISAEIQALAPAIERAGITVLCEMGLDPGVDHLYAVKIIDEVHRAGGKIRSFISNCGGLPAPEAAGNPFGLKLSWSPRGLLLAALNDACFIRDGKVVSVCGGSDLMDSAVPEFVVPGYSFVSFANRNSAVFKERYGISEATAIFRGTLRYPRSIEIFKALIASGFLDQNTWTTLDACNGPLSWSEVSRLVTGAADSEKESLIHAISAKTAFTSSEEKHRVIGALQWLGLFSAEKAELKGSPLDTLCALMTAKLAYGPLERDMVALQHKFEIELCDGTKETKLCTLLEFGDPDGFSAMARLVGTASAVASMQIIGGAITRVGLLAPLTPEISEPILEALKEYDIECIES